MAPQKRNMRDLTHLQVIRDAVPKLRYEDEVGLDALQRRSTMILANLFGAEHKYVKEFREISFEPSVGPMPDYVNREYWERGKANVLNLLDTIVEEQALFGSQPLAAPREKSRRIFIVHGRDEQMKEAAARCLSSLAFDPVILHEQPNSGRTIIEKFEDYADVGFAVVLLSPDDIGRLASEPPASAVPRPRQNVVLELGYFFGALGRNNVVPIYRDTPGFELPSDYSGVAFVPFDPSGAWRVLLARELKAAGYAVDANLLI
jgi:predicted nucleotide-binding protein